MFSFINLKFIIIDTGGMNMERIATLTKDWGAVRDHREYSDNVVTKIWGEVLGIIKDTLVMSVVVMAGAALTLLLW
jgi:hypothetical protein